MIPVALAGRRLAVVDVEGNGGQPPEIVEIAILHLDQPVKPEHVTTWLIRPQSPITPLVTRKVHGISNADVADCPTWSQVADQVTEALSDRVLIAHNASVEHRVLSAHLPTWQPSLVLDTLRLAKHLRPGSTTGYGLDRLIDDVQLDTHQYPGQRHRAGYDTWMTAQLLFTLVGHADLDWPELVRVAAMPGFERQEEGLW
ncbi:DNA polymerase III epsilon subunit-like protein [Actinokineospora baliensis]|uniref:3'-5' exonuclease n=1 Tax=Actinokineospora baliensis TaxID=547056 RepID=UPI0019599CF6|nr:3'-5' exonuclease [Actinokineospora baliensis]MBM7775999.1 DNA polymerase III epsilon subunit-like protein [Actinokineospora baliensis]